MKLWRWINPMSAEQVNKLKIQENQSCSSCPKVSRFKTHEEPWFWFESKSRGKKNLMSQFEGNQAERILSYSGDPPSAFCSSQSFD